MTDPTDSFFTDSGQDYWDDTDYASIAVVHDSQDFSNSPAEELIAAVIKQGFKDKDTAYINGRQFEFHCNLLGLDADNVRGLHEQYTRHA